MGVQRTSFDKLQRDRAKKAKQALKRERRQQRNSERTDEPETVEEATISEEGELTAAELLAEIERVHQQFDNEEIDFDEFEERKMELLERLPVD